MQLNFTILFILLLILVILLVFLFFIGTNYPSYFSIFLEFLYLLTLFFLGAFFSLLFQFNFYFYYFKFNYLDINYIFYIPLCLFFMFLLYFFIFFMYDFYGVIFSTEELFFFIMFLFITIFAVSSRDLISMFVWLQSLDLCLLRMLQFRSIDIDSDKSFVRHLFVSLLSSLILFMGILCIYYAWDIFSYSDISLVLSYCSFSMDINSFLGYIGLIFIVMSFVLKLDFFFVYRWSFGSDFFFNILKFTIIVSKIVTLCMFINFLLLFILWCFQRCSIFFLFVLAFFLSFCISIIFWFILSMYYYGCCYNSQ